jgi:putative lysine/arginine/ornithine/histidine/octopine transport system permease protein
MPQTLITLWAHADHLLAGVLVTLQAAVAGMALASLIGLTGALMRLWSIPGLSLLVRGYVVLLRSIPEVIVVLALYFGGTLVWGELLRALGYTGYHEINPLVAGIVALGLTFGSYATEIFRGAILSIPSGEIEAARAFGMNRWQCLFRVIGPQMLRLALPGLGNLFLVLIKDTSLLSVITVSELMRETRVAIGYTAQPFTFYVTAALLYLCLTTAALYGLRALERRTSLGHRTVASHEIF